MMNVPLTSTGIRKLLQRVLRETGPNGEMLAVESLRRLRDQRPGEFVELLLQAAPGRTRAQNSGVKEIVRMGELPLPLFENAGQGAASGVSS